MTDVAASVRARLQKVAKAQALPFERVLFRYANERILHRLSVSTHRESFVLKGAMLFTLWSGSIHRATKDLDFLGIGAPSEERIREVFSAVLERATDQPDGLVFDTQHLSVSAIREDKKHGGLRVTTIALLGRARIPVQIDIGFGDAAQPEWGDFPSLLEREPVRVRAYSRDTVVAEKVEAMVQLDVLNSRMKDFFDVAFLAQAFSFSGPVLAATLRATFERRGTALPVDGGSTLFARLREASEKPQQWSGFVRKAMAATILTFPETLTRVHAFVQEPLVAAAASAPFDRAWSPPGPWR